MVEKHVPPRETIAANLRAAMTFTKMSAPRVAKVSGVDRKTITNWLNGIYDPQPKLLDQVARVMGYRGWMLMQDDFDPNQKASQDEIARLTELFIAADEKGKESILSVAEMAAHYRR